MKLFVLSLLSSVLCKKFLVQVKNVDSFIETSEFFAEEYDNIWDTFEIGEVQGFIMEYDFFPYHLLNHYFVDLIEEDHSISINMPYLKQTPLYADDFFMLENDFDENEYYKDNEINEKQSYYLEKNPIWNLDRIDQRTNSLNKKYYYPTTSGENVNVFIIDTGIDVGHPEFEGRAFWAFNSADQINTDCNGHGTHVAGTVGSKKYGVAKKSTLFAVKVLDCKGGGSYSGLLSGIEYVLKFHKTSKIPDVVNMSLGGPKSNILNRALAQLTTNGVHVIVAAGNENNDACNTSPASEKSVMTVGAITERFEMASFSNWGTCVDIIGPGTKITSTLPNGRVGDLSGTSMASPAQAGIYALILSVNPLFSPEIMKKLLITRCSKDFISKMKTDTPNCLTYSLS